MCHQLGALDRLMTAPALYLMAISTKAHWLTTLLLPLLLLSLLLSLLLLLLPLCGTSNTLLNSPGECLKQLALFVPGQDFDSNASGSVAARHDTTAVQAWLHPPANVSGSCLEATTSRYFLVLTAAACLSSQQAWRACPVKLYKLYLNCYCVLQTCPFTCISSHDSAMHV